MAEDSLQSQLNYLNDQTGINNPALAPEPIGDPEVAQEKIPMVIDGKIRQMTQTEALNAQAIGAHQASDQEIANQAALDEANKTIDNTLGGARFLYDAATGIVSNYVPGGSLLLEKSAEALGADPTYAANMIKAGEDSTVGNVAGLATMLAPGNLMNKGANILGHAVETQAAKFGLNKAATWAAKNAAEGALYGSHFQVNEDTIENKPLTVESIAHGALMGSVGQMALALPIEGLKYAGSKIFSPGKVAATVGQGVGGQMDAKLAESLGIANQAEKEALTRLNIENGIEEVTAPSKSLPAMPAAMEDTMANVAAGSTGKDPELIKKTVFRDNPEAWQRRGIVAAEGNGATQRVANGMAEAAEKASVAFNDVREALSPKGRAALFDQPQFKNEFNVQGVTDAMRLVKDSTVGLEDAEIERVLRGHDFSGAKRAAAGLRRMVDDVYDAARGAIKSGNGGEFAEVLDRTRRYTQDYLETLHKVRPGDAAEAMTAEWVKSQATTISQALESAQRNPNLFGPTLAAAIEGTYTPWSKMIQAGKVLRESGPLTMKSVLSDIAHLEGLSTYDKHPSFSSGSIKSALMNMEDKDNVAKIRALRDYLHYAAETSLAANKHFKIPFTNGSQAIADANTVFGLLSRQADALHAHRGLSGGTSNAAVNVFESAARAAGYVTAGAAGSLLGGLVGGPFGAALGGGIGYMAGPVLGAGFNVGKQLNARMAVEQLSRAWDQRATKAANQLVAGASAQRASTQGMVNAQNYSNFAQKITAAAANPMATVKAVNGAFGQAMTNLPTIGAMAGVKMTQAVNYMAQALPVKAPSTNVLQPKFERERPPSDMALASLNRKLEAVRDPITVWHNPTREGVEALKAVWPESYNDLRQKTMEAIAKSKEPIPFNQRQKMSMLFGFQTDALQDPSRYAIIQQTFQAAQEKAEAPSKPVDMANGLLSISDRIEQGGKP